MKRVLALVLLIACCILAMTACGGVSGTFTDLINETNPSSVKIEMTTTSTALSDSLLSEYLVRYNSDGSATITGFYEKFAVLDVQNPITLAKERVQVNLTQNADGTYTDASGSVADSSEAAPMSFKINLSMVEKNGSVSENGDVFTVTVPKADTEKVLGTAFPYDVTLEITKSEDMLEKIELTYASETDGVSGTIVCKYNK